eukprot:361217-Chlamydomonas_euryale.AAC.4
MYFCVLKPLNNSASLADVSIDCNACGCRPNHHGMDAVLTGKQKRNVQLNSRAAVSRLYHGKGSGAEGAVTL